MTSAESSTAKEPELAQLMEVARRVAEHSYSPYSKFKVGSALLLNNGSVVTGTNVENASYGLTFCAERSALVRAVAEFGPAIRIKAIAVANLNGAASPPCGACRQMLAEFAEPDAPVVFPCTDGLRTMAFSALLPATFEMKSK
jgi:cytidine deaminase